MTASPPHLRNVFVPWALACFRPGKRSSNRSSALTSVRVPTMANATDTHTALPGAETVAKAADATVYDVQGKEVSFASIIQDQKTVVVFIRAFFPP